LGTCSKLDDFGRKGQRSDMRQRLVRIERRRHSAHPLLHRQETDDRVCIEFGLGVLLWQKDDRFPSDVASRLMVSIRQARSRSVWVPCRPGPSYYAFAVGGHDIRRGASAGPSCRQTSPGMTTKRRRRAVPVSPASSPPCGPKLLQPRLDLRQSFLPGCSRTPGFELLHSLTEIGVPKFTATRP
jgi:hypothetical protein